VFFIEQVGMSFILPRALHFDWKWRTFPQCAWCFRKFLTFLIASWALVCSIGFYGLVDHELQPGSSHNFVTGGNVKFTPEAEVESITQLPFEFAVNCLYEGKEEQISRGFKYPVDADAHFDQIQQDFEQIYEEPHHAAGYSGPWIENFWISEFKKKLSMNRRAGKKLKDIFGPFIPLFIPWVDIWVNANPDPYKYPASFKGLLNASLRQDVLYVTVSQSDSGIHGGDFDSDFSIKELNNILVLSSGGYGHVAIPLLKGPLKRCDPLENHEFLISFPGTVAHAPGELREIMAGVVSSWSAENNISSFIGRSENWKKIMCDSHLTLCPRGYGRTSYRLAESIQLGRVPVFIYSDVLWVPYPHLYEKFGYAANIYNIESVLQNVLQAGPTEMADRESILTSISESHFTYLGVIEQISLFLISGHSESDLRCQTLPASKRDEG